MAAPADKTGYPKAGPPAEGSPGPEPPPNPAGSGPGDLRPGDLRPRDMRPGDPRPGDAALSPYLRRRLRSLAEALRDVAAGRRRSRDPCETGRPATEVPPRREAERRDPAALEPVRPGRAPFRKPR